VKIANDSVAGLLRRVNIHMKGLFTPQKTWGFVETGNSTGNQRDAGFRIAG
jgi:hypothetical protein